MVIRYAALAALGAASIWALLTVGASNGQWLLADAEQVGGEQGLFFLLLAVIAALMTFSLGRFLVSGRPPMVDSWYAEHKHWIYVILGGGLLYAAYVLT
jgi:hypothetical protein